MFLPSSTYRLQFNKEFTFQNLQQILPYLIKLGPGAVYASPVFSAVPGSNHGYDVTHPNYFNPEIGTADEFRKIGRILRKKGIGWIQDIVPNHMALHPDNHWLMDVLKHGQTSEYAAFFDIDWNHPEFKHKVMIPILGDSLLNSLKNGQIKLGNDSGALFISFGDFRLPVNAETKKELENRNKDLSALCTKINSDISALTSLLARQYYVLTHWQKTDTAINYRRFFTINGLISLKMDDPRVFEQYHRLIFRMLSESLITGIRIDHIDGLKKPIDYFGRLRSLAGEDVYIVAEKILERNETFDNHWPLQGSSGYDFLALVNGLFTGNGISNLSAFYSKTAGINITPEELMYEEKKAVLKNNFSGDLDNICRQIIDKRLVLTSSAITYEKLREAIGEFIVGCPVYKLYSDDLPLNEHDLALVKSILDTAAGIRPDLRSSFHELKKLFASENSNEDASELFLRIMQYTGPVMAKGVEDSAMYTWSALISRNEVGDSIDAPPVSVREFHEKMSERRDLLPASINATSTHDTKRGEDSRARLNVISDIPAEWIRFYREWSRLSKKYRYKTEKCVIPDENEAYFLCQVILGALPMDGIPDNSLIIRIDKYLRKALREAKIHSNWNNPDIAYEDGIVKYASGILKDTGFPGTIRSIFETLRDSGIINSLSQVVLKCMCPGIPDFYQGTESWDLSFVDPDNRRQVDYTKRKKMLETLRTQFKADPENFLARIYKSRFDAGIKLWLIHRLLAERFSDPRGFVYAEYVPLKITGVSDDQILAFARVFNDKWYIAIVPLHHASIRIKNNENSLNFRVLLPVHAPGDWINLWDDSIHRSYDGYLEASVIRFNCPVVLKGNAVKSERGSGVLMHISSLPGKYGTGSTGREAFEFVRLLKKGGQKYWQILPINPAGIGHSPYSSPSAFAGNTLFIDPSGLYTAHYIRRLPHPLTNSRKTDFVKAATIREKVFSEAYETYIKRKPERVRKKFEEFCSVSEYWLHDFALFSLIRRLENSEWNKWPSPLKKREQKALNAFTKKNHAAIEQIKFIQFLFHEQFSELKFFAQSFGIKIIGDLSICMAYESADVWAHPELFNLDENFNMITVAGVPPDFFSRTGQLWNMPVYNWKKMEKHDYEWWKKRIRRNLEYCDLLRIDHFRALSAYWEIPAGEKTAKNGRWTAGPGIDFFNSLKREFPDLPFIAEDLGDIDEDVVRLRDQFRLPGMKILMFAFDQNMPHSIHIPFNFPVNSLVYTGTHDNNTVRGWYQKADIQMRKRISEYLGNRPGNKTIAWEMIRMALTSVSKISIISVQDILSLDETARMNIPAKTKGNWTWKIKDFNDLTAAMERLNKLTYYTGRS